jgi:hypothetical protein
VPTDAFVTEEFIRHFGIRPGMEAFMMGRLIGRDGLQQTNPPVRFGHLGMMPDRVTPWYYTCSRRSKELCRPRRTLQDSGKDSIHKCDVN